MRYFTFPLKDASIYEQHPTRQTGIDEILDIGKNDLGSDSIRSLIQFDTQIISESLATRIYSLDSRFNLILFPATASKLELNQQIECFPLSQSWSEGAGYLYQDIYQEPDGATWNVRSSGSNWNVSGGSYYTSSVSSSISNPLDLSISIDITDFVRSWVSGTLPNNGLILKFPETDESSSRNKGRISMFSKQTHTIYSPLFVAKWDDQIYSTGSLSGSDVNGDINIIPKNLNGAYFKDELVRVNLGVVNKYPLKTFASQFSNYSGNQYLPITAYFSIVDVASGHTVIPFDDYSKISVDSYGCYIKFTTNQLYPLRFYKIIYKVVFPTTTKIYDSRLTFTIRNS